MQFVLWNSLIFFEYKSNLYDYKKKCIETLQMIIPALLLLDGNQMLSGMKFLIQHEETSGKYNAAMTYSFP
jgi:hypothetical protein